MEYVCRLHPRALRQISQWGLSDSLLVDVYLRLREDLTRDPVRLLHRDEGGAGSLYAFELTDPGSREFRHLFMFRVFFDEDEHHLNVVHGSYFRDQSNG